MNFILNPWEWYISGPLIALVMLLLIFMNKNFGMSANLRTMCTMCGADKKADFFKFDWKAQRWNLLVIFGAAVGGFIAYNYLSVSHTVDLSNKTTESLSQLGFKDAGKTYLPEELFQNSNIWNLKTFIPLALGGLFVGFGARYAGGCTSGHAISGLSNLQLPSLLAVIGFFIGGLIMVHLLFPLIF